ncbi:MAG: glycosyltransferase family 4 protein [Agriterribacter sp.]
MANPKLKFVALYFGNPQSGINKKVISQVQGLRDSNIDAELIFLGNKGADEVFEQDFIKFLPTKTPPYKSFFDKLQAVRSLRMSYEKLFFEGDDKEVIYLRGYLPAFWFYKAVKKTRKKVILELPSNPFGEALSRKSYIYYLSLCLYHKPILKNLDLLIGTTTDLLYTNFNPEKYKVAKMVIGNGVNVNAMPLRKRETDLSGPEFNFTCVAELSPPHGIDRILRGLSEYKGKDIINLHIVGKGALLGSLKQLTEELKLKNVTFHGFLSGDKLNEIFEETDLALAPLAIHRSDVTTNSSIKAREYSARGIPFAISGMDEEFPEGTSFVYHIESNETSVDVEAFIDFMKKVIKMPGYKEEMREYAVQNLSWDIKMKKLAEFIKTQLL